MDPTIVTMINDNHKALTSHVVRIESKMDDLIAFKWKAAGSMTVVLMVINFIILFGIQFFFKRGA